MNLKFGLYIAAVFFFLSLGFKNVFAVKRGTNKLTVLRDSCDSAGVYLTHDDYLKKKLSLRINPNRKGNRLTFSLNRKTIKLSRPDTIAVFKPGSIYGYYNCGERLRWFKNSFYTIVEKSPLVIYTITMNSFSGMTEVKYFYSMTSSSDIRSLTMKNVQKDFSTKPAFVTEVKNRFKWWSGLAATDDNGKLLINELWGEYKYRNE